MLKKILAFVVMLYATLSFAAVDVNKATAAELDGIKGIGPSISSKIVDERKKGNFKDWADFIERVKGIGDGNAAKFSAEGLTVGGAAFKGVAAAPAAPAAAKKDDKPAVAAKTEEKKAEAKPAAAAPAAAAAKEEKKDPKAEAKAKKEADKKAADEEKAKKADEAKAKKEEAKKAKDAKPASKDDKAEAAKPAASAAKK